LAVPVISVENLTWGGNGKTPMTKFLAFLFLEAGLCLLIFTRVMEVEMKPECFKDI
jgi:tetraacyldisaccharide-1-P 4'-kinase